MSEEIYCGSTKMLSEMVKTNIKIMSNGEAIDRYSE
jgi:hypothetical protein